MRGVEGRIHDAPLLADKPLGGQRAGDGILLGDLPVEIPVHLEDLELAGFPVPAGNLVVLCELHQHMAQRGVLRSGHRREQVVLKLVLHAAPEPLRERVRHHGGSGRLELRRNPIGLVLVEHLLRLVGRRDDEGAEQAGHEDRRKPHPQGEETDHDGVVDGEGSQAGLRSGPSLLHVRDGRLDRIEPPQSEEKAEGDVEDPVLDASDGAVVFGSRSPLVQERVGRDVLVASFFVGDGVVLVVLIGPPDGEETRREGREVPELVREGIDPVDVVVTEPPRRGEAQGEKRGRDDREGPGEEEGSEHEAAPHAQKLSLVVDVAFPPSVRFELVEEFSEGDLDFAVGSNLRLELLDGFRLRLRKPGVHLAGLVRVEPVHDLRGVPAVVPIEPVISGGVRLPPAREIVPDPVDSNVEGGSGSGIAAAASFGADARRRVLHRRGRNDDIGGTRRYYRFREGRGMNVEAVTGPRCYEGVYGGGNQRRDGDRRRRRIYSLPLG
mmetsp:Transcript_19733/g.46099  ORF Transcript_19733/g.46099 Transcript_19733/m.46099 type:complete len:495 (-) Transcript_19733:364-1848(-)